MDNEDYVRLHWVKPEKKWIDHDSYGSDVFELRLGEEYIFSDTDYEAVWTRAAKFTWDRLQKIVATKEEVDYLEVLPKRREVERLLSKTKIELASLTKGLKINA
jgi:hypothetical protein